MSIVQCWLHHWMPSNSSVIYPAERCIEGRKKQQPGNRVVQRSEYYMNMHAFYVIDFKMLMTAIKLVPHHFIIDFD